MGVAEELSCSKGGKRSAELRGVGVPPPRKAHGKQLNTTSPADRPTRQMLCNLSRRRGPGSETDM
jgi:hypothetical protein